MNQKLRSLRLAGFSGAALLVECLAIIIVVRIGLTLSSYKTLRKYLLSGLATQIASADDAGRIGWAIRNVARVVPHASCLTQALAGQVALSRRGKMSSIKIGVQRSQAGALQAHAWLISNDVILLGGNESSVATFTPIAEFGADK